MLATMCRTTWYTATYMIIKFFVKRYVCGHKAILTYALFLQVQKPILCIILTLCSLIIRIYPCTDFAHVYTCTARFSFMLWTKHQLPATYTIYILHVR